MITFHKQQPDFPVDAIPTKSQMVPRAYCCSFTSDEPFEVHFSHLNRDGEREKVRLYADKSLAEDLEIYSVSEIIPDHTVVEIVPVEDDVKQARQSVLQYALSVASQTLSKTSGRQEGTGK